MSQPYTCSGRHEQRIYMDTQLDTLPLLPARVHGFVGELQGSWLKFKDVRRTYQGTSSEDWQELVLFINHYDDSIARLEFFHWSPGGGEYRGVVIYDIYGIPLVHSINALLGKGYTGDGYDLSRKILMRLGVLESDLIDLNRRIHPYHYKPVVFSREALTDDGKSVILGAPVQGSWLWWLTEGDDED